MTTCNHRAATDFRFVFQYRQGAEDQVAGAGDSRHGGRGDRLLTRTGHPRQVSAGRRAALGGGEATRRPGDWVTHGAKGDGNVMCTLLSGAVV